MNSVKLLLNVVEIFDDVQARQLQELLKECVCAAGGMKTEEIAAFGDDYADIGMLELCGKGIAVGNAIEAVKEKADLVIGSNDEDGIAEYLEMHAAALS